MARGGLELFARCSSGFEQVLADELRELRLGRVRPQVGGVSFVGSKADAYRACLWSRVATRIQLVLARVGCATADELYRGVLALPWEDHLRRGATIAVDAHGENPQLRNTQFTALKVKDALCDRLRQTRGERPDVDAKDPDFAVDVAVHERKATVYLNLSGASLHRRGYRQSGVQTEAPLKETLAAGILRAAGWPTVAQEGGMLADPMCGSGTFAIEAALMMAQVAPGLLRLRWGFEGWAQHDQQLWERVRSQAEARSQAARPELAGPVRILAGDLDAEALEIARANATRAQVDDLIQFFVDDAARLKRHLGLARRQALPGLMVANPPYGQRLLTSGELPLVYAALSQAMEALPKGWQAAVITPDLGLDSALGRMPREVLACYNGPIKTWLHCYDAGERQQVLEVTSLTGVQRRVPVADLGSQPFAARLRKMARERARWARKAQVSCYRIYDSDLPDFALSVDWYCAATGEDQAAYLLIEERRRPSSVDAIRAERRLADAVALAQAVLDIPHDRVVVRAWKDARTLGRKRAQDGDGRRADGEPRPLVLEERGLRVGVDLAQTQSVFPLAQRGVRDLAAELAVELPRGARIAGLFATSGAAMARAAQASGSSTVVVDGSSEWLGGVRDLFAENGLMRRDRSFVARDVRAWLADEQRGRHQYDLVVCVAPAWLAAAGGSCGVWDFARDHIDLARRTAALLAPGGMLLFACSDFSVAPKLADLAAAGFVVEDVSERVTSVDFTRARPKPSACLVRVP